jgi:rubrerythrin
MDLAQEMERPAMREVFEGFAREEKGHKAKLEAMKQGKIPAFKSEQVTDLKMADYVVDVEATPNLGYEDALILAMKKEKAAFKLYTHLAQATDDASLQNVFRGLAQEEAKHKLRFEIEYDEYVMSEN